jgi:hypothetical protein
MESKELRLGNLVMQNDSYGYVYSIESAEPRQDKRFSDKDIISIFDNGLTYVPIDECKHIELTEDIILRLGFKKHKIKTSIIEITIDYYQKENFIVYLLNDFFEVELINRSGNQFNLYKTFKKEVHVLQNIYFALTSTELTLI